MELMVVIAVIAFLSFLAVPPLMKVLARAKRSEAYANLRSLYVAQKAYFAEQGTYATALSGHKGLGWKPEGKTLYTYGIGHSGNQVVLGTGGATAAQLQGASSSLRGFVAVAVADIDGDGEMDVVSIDQDNNLQVAQDDLE